MHHALRLLESPIGPGWVGFSWQVYRSCDRKIKNPQDFASVLRPPCSATAAVASSTVALAAYCSRRTTGRPTDAGSTVKPRRRGVASADSDPHKRVISGRFRRKVASGQRRARKVPLIASQDMAAYEAELQEKVAEVRELLKDHLPVHREGQTGSLEIVRSPEVSHYRHRIRFALSHPNSNSVGFLVFDPETAEFVPVSQSPVASARINCLMRDVMEVVAPTQAWDCAYEAELVSNTTGEAMASFRYDRPLDPIVDGEWAAHLANELDAAVVLEANKDDRIVAAGGRGDYLVQRNELNGRCYPQHFMDYVFSQTNVQLNKEMQRWVQAQTRSESGLAEGNLLELYCGNGNFTLPAAQNFLEVIATEVDRRAVSAARACAAQAGVRNVRVLRLKAEEVYRAFPPGYRPGTLLVDPPRAGLDQTCIQLAEKFERIVYISCNPETLRRDLDTLSSHRVTDACLFDQFPWTDHVEVGVRLERV
eukprot:TRINITY_DN29553_c0_g1_i1.p1 TRINITY_DN29553_c0_g1~~TRINITY_DN29553_c0_g1_i1.p1  ORF type:complete len:521 (-),score=75.99 TRINITY_DN29553_c0_g1_i1:250-1686(-)